MSDDPTTAAEVIALIIKGLYPDIPVFGDTQLEEYLGVFPSFRVHQGISRVRVAQSGTHRTRVREQVQVDFWQQFNDSTDDDTSVVPALEQAFDDFVPVCIGTGGTVMRLVADGPGRHDFNPQTLISQDLLTVTATIQPAKLAQPIGA